MRPNLQGDTNAGTIVLKCLLRPKVVLSVSKGFVSGMLRIQEIQGYHFPTAEKVKGKVGLVLSMNEWFLAPVASTSAAVSALPSSSVATTAVVVAGTVPSTSTSTTTAMMVSGKGGIDGGSGSGSGGSGGSGSGSGGVEKSGSPGPIATSPGPVAVGETMVPWQATTTYQSLTPPSYAPLWSGLGGDMKPAVTAKSLMMERLVFSVVSTGNIPQTLPLTIPSPPSHLLSSISPSNLPPNTTQPCNLLPLSGDNKHGGSPTVLASGGVGLMDAGACVGKNVTVEVDLYYPTTSTPSTGGTSNTVTKPTPTPTGSTLFGRLTVNLIVDAKEQPRIFRPLPSDFQQGVLHIVKLKTFDLANTEALAMFGDKQGGATTHTQPHPVTSPPPIAITLFQPPTHNHPCQPHSCNYILSVLITHPLITHPLITHPLYHRQHSVLPRRPLHQALSRRFSRPNRHPSRRG